MQIVVLVVASVVLHLGCAHYSDDPGAVNPQRDMPPQLTLCEAEFSRWLDPSCSDAYVRGPMIAFDGQEALYLHGRPAAWDTVHDALEKSAHQPTAYDSSGSPLPIAALYLDHDASFADFMQILSPILNMSELRVMNVVRKPSPDGTSDDDQYGYQMITLGGDLDPDMDNDVRILIASERIVVNARVFEKTVEVYRILERLARLDRNLTILVAAEPRIPFKHLVALLDQAERFGLQDIRVVRKKALSTLLNDIDIDENDSPPEIID